MAPTQDIRSKSSLNADVAVSALEEKEENSDLVRKSKRRAATKSLCVHLTLIAKLRSPKSLSKETKLRELYMNLLTHREAEVQRLAMNCLFSYKFPYLEPYREQLEKLLIDETFREALIHFSIDKENSIVEPAHRENLVPILIRFVFKLFSF